MMLKIPRKLEESYQKMERPLLISQLPKQIGLSLGKATIYSFSEFKCMCTTISAISLLSFIFYCLFRRHNKEDERKEEELIKIQCYLRVCQAIQSVQLFGSFSKSEKELSASIDDAVCFIKYVFIFFRFCDNILLIFAATENGHRRWNGPLSSLKKQSRMVHWWYGNLAKEFFRTPECYATVDAWTGLVKKVS